MEALRQQKKYTPNRADLAMKTLALPSMGSAAYYLGQITLIGNEASSILRCKDTAEKAAFVRQCVAAGLIGERHLRLLGRGADNHALDILTNDAIYEKGKSFFLDRKEILSNELHQQIEALLSRPCLSRSDTASQFKLLVKNGEVTLEQIQTFIANGQGHTNALSSYLESYLEKIAFVESPIADFNLSATPAGGNTGDLEQPSDIQVCWGIDDSVAPHQVNYPRGDDNHSVLKRDLIDTVMAATQRLVLNFITPHDFIHGFVAFEDSEVIQHLTKSKVPSVQAITALMKNTDIDELCETLPGFFHSGILSGNDEGDDESIEAWANDIHNQLAMRAKTSESPLPLHLTTPQDNDKPALIEHLRQRVKDAETEWLVEDKDCLETLSAWVEWLHLRVKNNLPYLDSDYLRGAASDKYDSYEHFEFEHAVIALPGCSKEIENTLINMLHQDSMETGSEIVSTIRHDQPDDMAQFLDATRGLSTLLKFISQL